MVVNGMQVLGLNLIMNLGEQTQTVTVSAAPPPLETADATVGGRRIPGFRASRSPGWSQLC